jgi:hypothetical protein|tara:strand:+ start:1891 stop:2082 length:192 start_codon:yes stop_codon:yes gene_type:complete
MAEIIKIPRQEYNFLKKCERIVKEIEEDESLNEEEINLIEISKDDKRLNKDEFLDRFNKLQNV